MKKSLSLSTQFSIFMLADLLLCILFVFGMNFIGQRVIDEYWFSRQHNIKEAEYAQERFVRYVEKYGISSGDYDRLNDWGKRERYVSIQMYKDGYLVYSSTYGNDIELLAAEQIPQSDLEKRHCISVQFCDGSADVMIHSAAYLKYYNTLLAVSLFTAVVFYLVSAFLFTSRKFQYITLLRKQVDRISEGDVGHDLTIRGADEITSLAQSMETVRRSVSKRIFSLEMQQKERDDYMAEMAHDVRTPLTAMLMYLDLLQASASADGTFDRRNQEYLGKITDKAGTIKVMLDDLFGYFKIEQEQNTSLEQAFAPDLLYDFLGELDILLAQGGFQVQESVEVPEYSILFNAAYMSRIAGNIVSNIRKYADSSHPVSITLYQEQAIIDSAGSSVPVLTLNIRNLRKEDCNQEAVKLESMGIGVRNVKKMMEHMAGDMRQVMDRSVEEGKAYYELRLMFRIANPQRTQIYLDRRRFPPQ